MEAAERSVTDSSVLTVESNHHGIEAGKDVAFGSLAGVAGKTIEFPFDTVKVRLQSQPDGFPLRYTGPLDCFRQSVREEGIRGLYRGISAPLFGAAVETSSLFFSYRIAQNFLHSIFYPASVSSNALPLPALVACGAFSGAFTSLSLTPIELIKCQMQVPISSGTNTIRPTLPGPLTLIASVYRHHGLLGFWHGQLGTLIRETGGSAAWFGTYEGVSLLFRKFRPQHAPQSTNSPLQSTSLPIYQQMIAGAFAGMSYNFIFFPADTIKSRMQTEEVGQVGSGARKSFGAVARALWKQQGLRGLYQGCGITVARSAPSSAFIFAIYEGMRGYFA